LNLGREVADLVQKQRAAIRGFDQTDPAIISARKGAFLMPEQFRLNQIDRQSSAIHRDEGRCRPRGILVDGTRRLLFSGSALASDQDRHIHFGSFLDASKQGLHDQAVTDQPILRFQLALLAQRVFGQHRHAIGVPERYDQALRLDR